MNEEFILPFHDSLNGYSINIPLQESQLSLIFRTKILLIVKITPPRILNYTNRGGFNTYGWRNGV